MNKFSLTSKLKKLSLENNTDFNLLLLLYFMEEFLIRISLSPYANEFIFKGGFLLSSMLGITNRTTMDMDISVTNINLNTDNTRKVIESIIKCDDNQLIKFEIQNIEPIREADQYGGLEVKLLGVFENIRQPFSIDIATGDPITPSSIQYNYHLLTDNKSIYIKSYNIETVIAEKLQTIFIRGLANSRCKDFYDLYFIYKTQYNNLNINTLCKSIENTFQYRNTEWDINEVNRIFSLLKDSEIMKKRWRQFTKSHLFANQIVYDDVITEIQKIVVNIEANMHQI